MIDPQPSLLFTMQLLTPKRFATRDLYVPGTETVIFDDGEVLFIDGDVIWDGCDAGFRGVVMGKPYVPSSFSDLFYGIQDRQTVSVKLSNIDNDVDDTWDDIIAAEEILGTTVKIERYDPEDGKTFEATGKITSYNLGSVMDLSIEIRAFDELNKMLPAKTVDSGIFTNTAENPGALISILYGKCYNVWCPNVNNDTANNHYDYLIGHGTLKGLLEDSGANLGVKRDGILVNSSEYTFYDGSQGSPYPGYSFIRFIKEQRDFSNRFYNVTADAEGLELRGPEAIGNGDCATDTAWTVGANWSHDAVNGEYDGTFALGGMDRYLYQSAVLRIGHTFEVVYTIKNAVAVQIRALCGNTGYGTTRTADGTYTESIVCSGNTSFYIQINAGAASVDDISVKPVYDRNFHHIIRDVLENTTYGLGENINIASFSAAASNCTNDLLCDFPVTERESAQDIFSELLFVCRSKIFKTEDMDWGILQDDIASSLASFGDSDGYYNNCTVEGVSSTPTNQSIKELTVEYNLYNTPVKMTDNVNDYGKDRTYRFRCFTDDLTAKNVFSYIKRRSRYSSKTVIMTAGAEARELVAGDVFTLHAPARNLVAQDYMIQSIQRGLVDFEIEGRQYDSAIFDYCTFVTPATFSQDYGGNNSPKYMNGVGITGVMQSADWGAEDGVQIDFSNVELRFGGYNDPGLSFIGATLTINGVVNVTDGSIDGGVLISKTVEANALNVNVLSAISANMGDIQAGSITGAVVQTAADGQRIVMRSSGIRLEGSSAAGKYGAGLYGTAAYGEGTLAYINHPIGGANEIPFVIGLEQVVADFHYFNRSSFPSGTAATGDIALVGGQLITAMTTSSPASWAVIGPNMCRFAAQSTLAQDNIAINSDVKVKFADPVYDVGNDYDESVGNYDFSAPMAGAYHFDIIVRLGDIDTAAAWYRLGLLTTGGNYYNIFDPAQFNADLDYWSLVLSLDVEMDAGDTAYVAVYQSGGAVQTDIDMATTIFSGHAVYQQDGG